MNEHTARILAGGAHTDVPVPAGRSLLAALRAADIYLSAPCGGGGTCGKCRVRLVDGTLAPSEADTARFTEEELAVGWRLACIARPAGDVTIELPGDEREAFSAVTGFALESAGPMSGGLAVAVDIGTTTLGFALVDRAAGEVTARLSLLNAQRQYGADVISRILRAGEGDLAAMRDLIRGQLAEGIARLCAHAGVSAAAIEEVAVTGNTTMEHILMGHSCAGLGVSPFTPVSVAPQSLPTVLLPASGLDEDCPVHVLPGFTTFVGADVACGALITGLDAAQKPALLLDIGTNGEMALAQNGRLLCTSTAAGPAFEGGNIAWGTGSVPGAISGVAYKNGTFAVETIGGAPPVGICGSGVIDAVYACLAAGLIDETGRLEDACADEGIELARTAARQAIRLTQKDVREMQLAKSAIRSGIDVLLRHAGLAYEDVDALYLAGGFGYTINLASAAGIGLLPKAFVPRTVAVGNAALGGAAAWLGSEEARRRMAALIAGATEYGLSEDPLFNQLFVENMLFEEE